MTKTYPKVERALRVVRKEYDDITMVAYFTSTRRSYITSTGTVPIFSETFARSITNRETLQEGWEEVKTFPAFFWLDAENKLCTSLHEEADAPEPSAFAAGKQVGGNHYGQGSGVSPWDMERHMVSSGDCFVDSRRTDVIEYMFREKDSWLIQLGKAKHNIEAAIQHIQDKEKKSIAVSA